MSNQNNKFINIVNKIADIVLLSILWCICCIPILTIGSASAALYYSCIKVICNDTGYAFTAFMHSFRQNLKQSLNLTLISLFIAAVLIGAIYICLQNKGNILADLYLILNLVLLFIYIVGEIHLYALLGRFHLSTKEIFTVILFILKGNIIKNIMILFVFAFAVEAAIYYPPLLFIIPGGFCFITSYIQEPLYKKYIHYNDDNPNSPGNE